MGDDLAIKYDLAAAALSVVAVFFGLQLGRKVSAGIFLACAVAVAALSMWALQHPVTMRNVWVGTLGTTLVCVCLALLGPIAFENRARAVGLSAGLVAFYILTVFPVLLVSCYLFAQCV